MGKAYYFLASLLPRLEIGHIPSLGFSELMEVLRINLSDEDNKAVIRLLRLIDFENMRALFANEPLDPRGNYNQRELEEAIKERAWFKEEIEFTGYLREFLDRNESGEKRLANFPKLLSRFLIEESRKGEGFLSKFFAFERDLRLVLLGFRARAQNRDIALEIPYEDPREPIIAELLAQKDSIHFEPPFEFRELKPIFENYGNSPVEFNKALIEYRFKSIQDLYEGEIFSIDRILGYIVELILVERYAELDLERGMQVIHTLEENIQ